MKPITHGTYAGYRAHRRRNEEICGDCRLAMNKHRREYHKKNPHKNIEYGTTYRNKPEKLQAKAEARAAATAARTAKKEAQQRVLLLKRIHRLMVRHIKATAQAEAVKKILEESRRIELEKEMAAQARRDAHQARLDEWAHKRRVRAARSAERRAARDAIRAARRAEEEANKQARKSLRAQLANQHGKAPGDYTRCKKRNGKACPECRAFIAEYMREKWNTDPRYRQWDKEWAKRNPDKIYRDHRDRALKHGAKHKYYTREQIFKRDGYDCHICKAPVDLKANHIQGQPGWELYPHIDHVIPISKGGDDTLENVKIAHAICNISKGANLSSTV